MRPNIFVASGQANSDRGKELRYVAPEFCSSASRTHCVILHITLKWPRNRAGASEALHHNRCAPYSLSGNVKLKTAVRFLLRDARRAAKDQRYHPIRLAEPGICILISVPPPWAMRRVLMRQSTSLRLCNSPNFAMSLVPCGLSTTRLQVKLCLPFTAT
ncbi:hypothetical protein EDB19DRAFT_1703602, partial [Suillus lakei]